MVNRIRSKKAVSDEYLSFMKKGLLKNNHVSPEAQRIINKERKMVLAARNVKLPKKYKHFYFEALLRLSAPYSKGRAIYIVTPYELSNEFMKRGVPKGIAMKILEKAEDWQGRQRRI
jgi:hypothetical protein